MVAVAHSGACGALVLVATAVQAISKRIYRARRPPEIEDLGLGEKDAT